MNNEISPKVESCEIRAKTRKLAGDWTVEITQLPSVSFASDEQIGQFTKKIIPMMKYVVKNLNRIVDHNIWSDIPLTGVEKASYNLKYGVPPEKEKIANKVVIEELPAKSGQQ